MIWNKMLDRHHCSTSLNSNVFRIFTYCMLKDRTAISLTFKFCPRLVEGLFYVSEFFTTRPTWILLLGGVQDSS